jgi:ribulose-5-phosphate 4-epimerase/fuculose-1-phosphate aldolase
MGANETLQLSSVKALVSQEEWDLRVALAAAYRLVAMYRWDDLIFTHLSVRLPGPDHHFLINPYGVMFEEITASSLVKVDMSCTPLMPTPYPVNPAGFVIHSAIHHAREDVVCVMHTHTMAGIAVSAQKAGLLPISQQATIALSSLSYHDYEGIALSDDEKPRLVNDLGSNSMMILRNHGLLSVGPTVADAFLVLYNLQRACEIQVGAMAGGSELIPVPQAVLSGVKRNVQAVTKGMGGSLAWPGLMRRLARHSPGYDQ